jgi:hypothetical protein
VVAYHKVETPTIHLGTLDRGIDMTKMAQARNALAVAVFAAFTAASASSAMADTQWDKTHPRRDQVNDRLANQNKRITKEVGEGELTKQQAVKLHKQDRQIRKEERLMASQNGRHITKQEQKTLNQQENAVSKKIGE